MNNVQDYIAAINAALDSRASYESAKNAENDSIQSVITSLRKSMTHNDVATALMNNAVDAEFINRSERSNNRFNVYAAQKVDNAARAAINVESLNHYTLAILRVAVALEAKELTLTHKDAVAACSASVKHSEAKREQIIKSLRYAKHVAANTASTQSSSSINALQTLKAFSESRNANNEICYSVNRDSALVQALCARYEIALASEA